MGTTLENGIYLPDEGERNCYDGLAENWVALDNHLGSTNIHVTINDKQAWNGHIADSVKHVTAEDKQAWNGHVADTTIHVTSADKQAWNGKQDALSQTQLDAVNSGIDSSKVQQIATNTSDISSLQSGKANDSDVVHKSGNETINGNKTFSSINGVEPSSLSLPSDRNARIDISSYFTNTGNGDNEYVASANGYIFLDLGNVSSVFCTSLASNRQVNYRAANHRNGYGANQILFPITKGNTAKFSWSTSSTVTIFGAFFIPCIGNV